MKPMFSEIDHTHSMEFLRCLIDSLVLLLYTLPFKYPSYILSSRTYVFGDIYSNRQRSQNIFLANYRSKKDHDG